MFHNICSIVIPIKIPFSKQRHNSKNHNTFFTDQSCSEVEVLLVNIDFIVVVLTNNFDLNSVL